MRQGKTATFELITCIRGPKTEMVCLILHPTCCLGAALVQFDQAWPSFLRKFLVFFMSFLYLCFFIFSFL